MLCGEINPVGLWLDCDGCLHNSDQKILLNLRWNHMMHTDTFVSLCQIYASCHFIHLSLRYRTFNEDVQEVIALHAKVLIIYACK